MKSSWAEDAILWLGQAELDLGTAQQLISSSPYSACFYAQQAAEKSLKSIYVLYGLDMPRVHSIGRLIIGLEAQFHDLSPHRDDAAILDGYYIGTRYPSIELGQIPGKNYTKKMPRTPSRWRNVSYSRVNKFLPAVK